ncbi:MAG: DUF1015 family protein [Bacteroidota bacterium]
MTNTELLPFRALLPKPEVLQQDPEVLAGCRETFAELRATGVYQQLTEAALYLLCFRQTDGVLRYAIGGLLDVMGYNRPNGTGIRPHEATLVKRMKKHRKRILEFNGIIKPVLLTKPADEVLELAVLDLMASMESPYLRYQRWNGEVSLYTITDPLRQADLLAALKLHEGPLAVADGHHRIATTQGLAEEYGETFRWLPVMIMPAGCLGIDTFIRSVKGSDLENVAISDYFQMGAPLTDPTLPNRSGEWLLGWRGQVYPLRGNPTDSTLDAVWFDQTVLPALFGIRDSRTDARLRSTEAVDGIDTLRALMDAYPDHYHFYGVPLSMTDFFGCISREELLPPKSTYFFPRVPTGLIVKTFE